AYMGGSNGDAFMGGMGNVGGMGSSSSYYAYGGQGQTGPVDMQFGFDPTSNPRAMNIGMQAPGFDPMALGVFPPGGMS
ncbi:hypothetical protein LPJ61_005747, partial [Coemansia biformis]